MPDQIFKYPRTFHIEGSRLQPGDEDIGTAPFKSIKNKYIICEEKVDGSNSGLSFDAEGKLLLQSRGHYLTGGGREKHFNLLKGWASAHQKALWEVLGDRYVMYGEWLYAKHTVFYDLLPHYFLEFDILDTKTGHFLSTERRRALLAGLPVASVPVLREGEAKTLEELTSLIGPSRYKSPRWKERLSSLVEELSLPGERIWRETDASERMEGLYIKVEEEGRVVERYKYVRASFLTAVVDSGTHWLSRPIIPNKLREGVDIFSSEALNKSS